MPTKPILRQTEYNGQRVNQAGAGIWEAVSESLFGTDDHYKDFQKKYKNDRVGFARDCIKWPEVGGLCEYQEDLIRLLDEGCTRLSWRGPRGARKTSLVAIIIIHFILVHDACERNWKVATTASVGRQLTEFLWPEIHKWIRCLKWDLIGREPFKENKELMTETIVGKNGRAYAFVSNDPDKVEGFHADDMLIIFDESKAVPDESRKRVMGGITGTGSGTKQKATVIAVSTPGAPTGWFYDIHRGAPDDNTNPFRRWKAVHITQEMCIAAGSLSKEGLEELADECGGTETALYRQQGLGEFAADETSGIFPLEHIERAMARFYDWEKQGKPGQLTSLGLDVADGGQDDSMMAPCYGFAVDKLITLPKYPKVAENGISQTMAVVGDVVNFVRPRNINNPTVVVDGNAVGAGVVSRLKEIADQKDSNFSVQTFIAQKKCDKKVKTVLKGSEKRVDIAFGEEVPANMKAAAYLEFAFMLHPDSGFDVILPDNPRLKLELSTAKRLPPGSDGKISVMGKDAHKELLAGKSPDCAEAVIMGMTAGRITKQKRKAQGCYTSESEE